MVSVVLMRDLSADATLATKQEFEEKCATEGVTIKHYHADMVDSQSLLGKKTVKQ